MLEDDMRLTSYSPGKLRKSGVYHIRDSIPGQRTRDVQR